MPFLALAISKVQLFSLFAYLFSFELLLIEFHLFLLLIFNISLYKIRLLLLLK